MSSVNIFKKVEHFKLYGLLRSSTLLVWYASKRSSRLSLMLNDEPFVLQIRTEDGAAAYLQLKNKRFKIHLGVHPNPDLDQLWSSSKKAVKTMISRDETEIIRAVEDGFCVMNGKFLVALWFNEAMKISRPILPIK